MTQRRTESHIAPPHERHDGQERHDVVSGMPTDVRPVTINRISWGAVFAGTAVAFVAQIVFSLLGLAIGLTIIEPLTGQTPVEGIGIGAGIWWIVTALISLFLGGWTAGRLSGMPLHQDAILHGIVVWALVTIISLFFAVAGAGAVASGPFGMVQQVMQAITGGGMGDLVPELTNGVTMSAWWAFGAMVVGAIAVAIGGALGASGDFPASSGIRRE